MKTKQTRFSKEQLKYLNKIKKDYKYDNISEVIRDAVTSFIRKKTGIKLKSHVMR